MKQQNDVSQTDISANSEVMFKLDQEFSQKKELIKRLEYDVNVIEKEGRKMGKEYEKVLKLEIPETLPEVSIESIYSELKELRIVSHETVNDTSRLLTTGSPEGSTSGVSSSSSGDLNPEALGLKMLDKSVNEEVETSEKLCEKRRVDFKFCVGEDAVTSDTGLSSLHSSANSDEDEFDGNETLV